MIETLHSQTITAFVALISVLAVVFYAFLYPVREKQDRFERELKELKAGQVNLEKRMDRMESKLDKLLAKA